MLARVIPPRSRPWGWRRVAPLAIVGTLLVLWNMAHLANLLPQVVFHGGRVGDWYYWGQVNIDDPYAWEWVRWSPPAVWFNATIQPWAYQVVFAANLLALLLLPWRVALVMLLVYPFWSSQLHGSFTPMIVVAAWNALEGKAWGIVGFCAVAALIPRPLMLPVLAVLLRREPLARWAFTAGAVFVIGYAMAVDQLGDWIARLTTVGADQPYNDSPSRFIGVWWYPIGIALAVVLTWKRWYGLASLAISPYLFTNYLLFGLLDLTRLAGSTTDPSSPRPFRRRRRPGTSDLSTADRSP